MNKEKTLSEDIKIGDIVKLNKITPDFIRNNCPKKMIVIKQGEDKDFFSCYTLDKISWCGSLHRSYLNKVIIKNEQRKN